MELQALVEVVAGEGGHVVGTEGLSGGEAVLSGSFVEEALENIEIRKVKDPHSKLDEEAVITFETKEIRDAVKAQGHNLAKY